MTLERAGASPFRGPGRGAWLSAIALGLHVAVGACSGSTREFASRGADSSGGEPMTAVGGAPETAATGGASGSEATPQEGAESGSGAGGDRGVEPPCELGDTRSCAAAGLTGPCAAGNQTCEAEGWGPCSVQPESHDGCRAGDNADCVGDANEGCSCIEGVTSRSCGPCRDGRQTCIDGRADEYGSCEGATATPVVYYRDADGDGYGDAAQLKEECSAQVPDGFVARAGDCCDDGGNLTMAAQIHPGQARFFAEAAGVCAVTFDYDCNGSIETDPVEALTSCVGNCFAQYTTLHESDCGTYVALCSCGGSGCTRSCGSGAQVKCR